MSNRQLNFYSTERHFNFIILKIIETKIKFTKSLFDCNSFNAKSLPVEEAGNVFHQFHLMHDEFKIHVVNLNNGKCSLNNVKSEIISYSYFKFDHISYKNIRFSYEPGFYCGDIWTNKTDFFLNTANDIFKLVKKNLVKNKLLNYWVSPDLDLLIKQNGIINHCRFEFVEVNH